MVSGKPSERFENPGDGGDRTDGPWTVTDARRSRLAVTFCDAEYLASRPRETCWPRATRSLPPLRERLRGQLLTSLPGSPNRTLAHSLSDIAETNCQSFVYAWFLTSSDAEPM